MQKCLVSYGPNIVNVSESIQVVDFASNLFELEFKLFMLLPETSTVWSSFLDVFDETYWIIIVCCTICLSIAAYITWTSVENEKKNYKFSTSIALVLLAHVGLSLSVQPKRASTRINLLTICVTGMVIYWVYNSGLVSVLTVDKVEWPIHSVKVKVSQKVPCYTRHFCTQYCDKKDIAIKF